MTRENRLPFTVVLILLLIQGCQPATPAPPSDVPPTETSIPPTSEPARNSVVLISWDAARADTVYGLMEAGLLPTFSSLAAGGVRFIQREIFTGLLVPLFAHKLDTETRRGFEDMNKALKMLAEKEP